MGVTTEIDAATREMPPPRNSPAAAPAAVSPRHQMPSTSRGHRVDAATAKTSPTVRERSSETTPIDRANGTAPARIAATRKSRTLPERTSVLSTPAMLTSRPDEVDRKAAMAPAATSAASSWPGIPDSTEPGSSSTAASDAPVISNCGTYSRAKTPSTVGNR